MEKKTEPAVVSTKAIETIAKNVQSSMDSLYTDTYGNEPVVSRSIDYMRNKMHSAIDNIVNNNISNTGMSNISSLYNRVHNVQNDKTVIKSIMNTFENDSIMENTMALYSQNVYLKESDKEFDVIMKYMPKLYDALDTRKEAVLSADHFTKNSINITSSSTEASPVTAESNIEYMRETYDLDNLIERIYSETDLYGECFVYIVPYKKAIAKLLKKNINLDDSTSRDDVNEAYVNESMTEFTKTKPTKAGGITFEFSNSSCINEAVLGIRKASRILNENESISKDEKPPTSNDMYKTDNASDGTTITDGEEKDPVIKVPGAAVKILDHTMVKTLYIETICIGYYYIETDKPMGVEQLTFSSTLGGLKPGNAARKLQENKGDYDNAILKKIAKEISNGIDAKFVNANQDLTQEIYMILKYNAIHNDAGRISRVKVTFIPPEDMIHSFFKLDHHSKRGVSSLSRALFPAKLYSCLYITNTLAVMTRGNDKRVYYVKQNADTNISAVLLNTINQIKKSNFGLRQIENMNNIMNITGRFNDYVIPESASGEVPVRFEIMQGQEVNHPTDLMNQLEEMAVNATEVPMEVVQARQQLDFATHYTMSNTRFLRKVFNLQSKFTKICNRILTKIYDAEFGCDDSISVELPPPMYLNLLNSEQLMTNAQAQVEAITPMYIDVDNEDAELVALVKARIKKYYMRSFVPDEAISRIVEHAKMDFAGSKKAEQ